MKCDMWIFKWVKFHDKNIFTARTNGCSFVPNPQIVWLFKMLLNARRDTKKCARNTKLRRMLRVRSRKVVGLPHSKVIKRCVALKWSNTYLTNLHWWQLDRRPKAHWMKPWIRLKFNGLNWRINRNCHINDTKQSSAHIFVLSTNRWEWK